MTASSPERPWASPRPSVLATAVATSSPSVTGTRSTNQTPPRRRRGEPGGDGRGEARLAHPSRAGGGDQPVRLEGRGELGDLGGAPDERGERDRHGVAAAPALVDPAGSRASDGRTGRRPRRRPARAPAAPGLGGRRPRACAAATRRGSPPCGPTRTSARRSPRWWRAAPRARAPRPRARTRRHRSGCRGSSPLDCAVPGPATGRRYRPPGRRSVVDPWWLRGRSVPRPDGVSPGQAHHGSTARDTERSGAPDEPPRDHRPRRAAPRRADRRCRRARRARRLPRHRSRRDWFGRRRDAV